MRIVERKFLLSSIATLALSSILVSYAAAAQTKNATSGPSGTLTVVRTGDFTTFDPASLATPNWPDLYQIYSTLTLEDPTLKPQPQLATSWHLSKNKLALTLHLRHGVRFSDGTRLTAKDVVWNVDRYMKKGTAANILPLVKNISKATAPNRDTVILHLARPTQNIFDALDLMFISKPQPTSKIETNPIGTGPFKLVKWTPNNEAVFAANRYYWVNGEPKVKTLVIKDAPDPQTALDMLKTGSAQIMIQPPWTDLSSLKKSGYQLTEGPRGSLVSGILYNTTAPPFNNPKVREAISLALNRKAFINSYLDGHSTPWCLPWANGTPGYEASPSMARNCPQNLAKAKRLLAQAGYAHGFTTTMLVSNDSYVPGAKALAEVLQQDVAPIGIKLSINFVESAAAGPLYHTHQYALAGTAFGRANRDPATLFEGAFPFEPGNTETGYNTPAYTKLLNDLETSTSANPVRKSVLLHLDKILLAGPVTTVAPVPIVVASESSVRGLKLNQDGMLFLAGTSG